jgi:ferric-dicitrate binding protein FerR (iron transport regulator)
LKGLFMKIVNCFLKFLTVFALIMAGSAYAQVASVFELTGTATATAGTAPGAPPAAARTLRKGDAVNQGDTVATGQSSSIVLRFEDGQIAALSANSKMAIANYTYNRAEPAKSNVLLSLVEGGMRAVTGLIGKARPQSVSYRAGNATIGIRGTDVTFALAGGNLVVTVQNGLISFTFGGQTVTVPAGQGTQVNTMTPNAPVVVVPAATIAAALASTTAGSQLNTVLNNLNVAANAVVNTAASQTVGTGQTGQPATTVAGQGTPTGNVGISGGSGGSGGGGSTLPACSTVSPVSAARPGVNCN